tara:strand:- start:109 stop:588 length:480 start_codon:yes stop_codon:yes gene_type:complete
MPQLDFSTFIPQIFWLFVSLSILYLILSKYALPRVSDVIEERKDIIAHDIDEAKKFSLDSKKAIEDLTLKMSKAKSESQQIVNNALIEVKSKNETKKEKIILEINDELLDAEKEIFEKKEIALKDVTKISKELAKEMLDNLSIGKVDSKKLSNLSGKVN